MLHKHTQRFTHNTRRVYVSRWSAFNNLAVVSVEWSVAMDTTPIDNFHKPETCVCVWWMDVVMLFSGLSHRDVVWEEVKCNHLVCAVSLQLLDTCCWQVHYSASNYLFLLDKQVLYICIIPTRCGHWSRRNISYLFFQWLFNVHQLCLSLPCWMSSSRMEIATVCRTKHMCLFYGAKVKISHVEDGFFHSLFSLPHTNAALVQVKKGQR